MNIEKAIDLLSNGESDERMSGFIKYYANKLWAEYNEYLMNEIVVIENKVKERLSLYLMRLSESRIMRLYQYRAKK